MIDIYELLRQLKENTIEINNKYMQIESKLSESEEKILNLENEIFNLKNQNNEAEELNNGLLGDYKKIIWSVGNSAQYQIENGNLIVSGKNRYANISFVYSELEENYVENKLSKYLLYINGYRVKGCTNGYVSDKKNLLPNGKESSFILYGNWQREVSIVIALNQGVSEDSEFVITALRLSLT